MTQRERQWQPVLLGGNVPPPAGAYSPAVRAGGFVFDTYGSYATLYIGSFAIGLGAVAIALTFRPARVPPMQLHLKPA